MTRRRLFGALVGAPVAAAGAGSESVSVAPRKRLVGWRVKHVVPAGAVTAATPRGAEDEIAMWLEYDLDQNNYVWWGRNQPWNVYQATPEQQSGLIRYFSNRGRWAEWREIWR